MSNKISQHFQERRQQEIMKNFIVFTSMFLLGGILLGCGIDIYKWILIITGIILMILSISYGFICLIKYTEGK